MKYDFTSDIDRKGLDSIAAEPGFGPGGSFNTEKPDTEDTIPMWIADMNFRTLPDIPEAIISRAEHGLYGYFDIRDEYYDNIIEWQKIQNGVEGLERKHIAYENGVLGGVTSALGVLAEKGAPVLIHSPVYIGFRFALEPAGYKIITSPLVKDETGVWRMDYEDMDRKIKENHIHVSIFCTPHNPSGRVWEKWEIEKAMEVYRNNDVFVISDEIWSDIILPGYRHIPTQSVNEDARNRTVAFYAPSKTFNLAGLIGSYRIVYNNWIRERLDHYERCTHYNEMNLLSMHAAIAAFSDNGREWLKELLSVIEQNIDYGCTYIKENFKGVKVSRPQGTYMLFIDCEEWCREHGYTIEELWKEGVKAGVLWQDGRRFFADWSIRLNLASPHHRIVEAFDRLNKVFNK